MSVDALRGFDMFWIIGADSLAYALNSMARKPATQFIATQLEHAKWQGFHFYDLIFPLFLFLVGVSLVFSQSKAKDSGRASLIKRIARRGMLLYLLGVFYSGGLAKPWPDVRLMGVLNRIAIVYLITALLFHFLKPRLLAAVSISLLAGYWALLSFVPIRDVRLTKNDLASIAERQGDLAGARSLRQGGNVSAVKDSPGLIAAEKIFYSQEARVTGKYDPGYNLADHIDFQYLGGRKYDVFYDPEGLLSTLGAVGTCLLGVFAGLTLMSPMAGRRKALILVGFGTASILLGWLWNLQMPVIKKIWTPSYVLVAGGYSAILLGFFYFVVDVWCARKWCRPFVWIGMNSIAIYLVNNMLGGFGKLAARLVGGDIRLLLDGYVATGSGELMISLVGLLLAFWFAYFLYRRNVFLRL